MRKIGLNNRQFGSERCIFFHKQRFAFVRFVYHIFSGLVMVRSALEGSIMDGNRVFCWRLHCVEIPGVAFDMEFMAVRKGNSNDRRRRRIGGPKSGGERRGENTH
jgi:hypothetical protein